jgi:hypothetical protein
VQQLRRASCGCCSRSHQGSAVQPAKFEYPYVDVGNQAFAANAARPAVLASHQRFDFNLVHVGLNYKFLAW